MSSGGETEQSVSVGTYVGLLQLHAQDISGTDVVRMRLRGKANFFAMASFVLAVVTGGLAGGATSDPDAWKLGAILAALVYVICYVLLYISLSEIVSATSTRHRTFSDQISALFKALNVHGAFCGLEWKRRTLQDQKSLLRRAWRSTPGVRSAVYYAEAHGHSFELRIPWGAQPTIKLVESYLPEGEWPKPNADIAVFFALLSALLTAKFGSIEVPRADDDATDDEATDDESETLELSPPAADDA